MSPKWSIVAVMILDSLAANFGQAAVLAPLAARSTGTSTTPTIPEWVSEGCTGEIPTSWTSRSCPTVSCESSYYTEDPGPCTTAPPEIINPGPYVSVFDCTVWAYTGPRCSECGDNYCGRYLLPGEDPYGTLMSACPLGFAATTTTGYDCGAFAAVAMLCPMPTPCRATGEPAARLLLEGGGPPASTTVDPSECKMTVFTGQPCVTACEEGCGLRSTFP